MLFCRPFWQDKTRRKRKNTQNPSPQNAILHRHMQFIIPPLACAQVLQTSPSLAQDSMSALFRNSTLETVLRPFPKGIFFQGELKATELRWQRAPKTQIFVENRRFSQMHQTPGNSSIWMAQETADFHRKPKIFAENRRKPQIGLCHLRSVTFSSALFFPESCWDGYLLNRASTSDLASLVATASWSAALVMTEMRTGERCQSRAS